MKKFNRLTKRQMDVIEDLFQADLSESEILDKHQISRKVYNNWHQQSQFYLEFARRIDAASRECNLIIAKYAPHAAAKLVQLTQSEKDETRRKACLDIISLPKSGLKIVEQKNEALDDGLTEEMAEKLLHALANQ